MYGSNVFHRLITIHFGDFKAVKRDFNVVREKVGYSDHILLSFRKMIVN